MRVRFDRFELDTDLRLLLAESQPVHVSPKAFHLLQILVESHPKPLSKQQLTDRIWADAIVEESNLASLIAEIRSALGDDARNPRFVRTVHTFGYGFCFELVTPVGQPCAAVLLVRGDAVRLRMGENVVGRDTTCSVIIDDATISRRHARILIADGAASVEDLGSKNGTFVDGARIEAATSLRDRQTITFGEVNVVFASAGAGAATVTMRGA